MNVAELYQIFRAHPVVTTDSRRCPQGSIFFALKGESFDGNQFAAKALEQGCAVAVVDDPSVAVDKRYVVVPDVLEALQRLAHHHREQMPGKMILQITGTNGKTTTKELVSTVLAQLGPVQYTQGNLNNHIGVPLTLLTLQDDNGFGVIETGANHPGEIAFLSKIVDPDMGLITNVGRAHLQGFGSFEGVKRTKGELYDYIREENKIGIFLNASDENLSQMAEGLGAVRYGLTDTPDVDVWGEVVDCNPFVRFRYRQSHIDWQTVQTHLIGAYNIHNLMAAVAVGVQFGVPFSCINQALANYIPSNSRSEFRDTGRNHLIIDAYNANPSSMAVAIDSFAAIEAESKLVILGEMRELGEESRQEHAQLLQCVADRLPGCEVWLVGEAFRDIAPAAARCFADVEEVKAAVADLHDRTILIKGSNGNKLFQLPALL
ncbi:MAG: UDP-N-acetylmuramoyl-tripeptide--D-alanyl-D-alanine ligase [Bacteroidaceae bacterium]|nr:UDP-N-acetylmuramoyl-tripeptide--D-alanyl-D-alanine ligase [Bacteroidaceae bacterium]